MSADEHEHDGLGDELSALWSGDLPEREAEALRRRIATEPEVGVRWDRLCRALEALEALPDELTPPPLRTRAEPQPPVERQWPARAVPWALLAASAGLWLWPAPAQDLVLAAGTQWVEGEVRLAAGDVLVDVDGEAWISVEPAAPVPRVGSAEGEMNRAAVVAGLAGAVVTVAVYEGTAVVRAASDGGEPVVVEAGETHRRAPPGATKPRPVAPAATAAERLAEVTRLEQELTEAKQALAESEFAGALTRGQLQALQGTPSPWPDDVAPALAPEAFRAGLEARLAELGDDVEIASVDCDEYPCVAAIQKVGDADDSDWNDRLRDSVSGWLQTEIPEDLSVSVNTSRFTDGDRVEQYVIFGAHQGERDSDVGRRTEFRIDAVVDELGERMREPAP
jgi:ferric-dicitrate binding protein FerR (iron transport regulator)